MEETNGNTTPPGPLAGWIILQSNGCKVIGKPVGGDPSRRRIMLSPVYELHPQIQPIGPGQIQLGFFVAPLWCCKSITSLDLPADAIGVSVDSLDDGDRLSLAQAVEGCERLIASLQPVKPPSAILLGGSVEQAKADAMQRSALEAAVRGRRS